MIVVCSARNNLRHLYDSAQTGALPQSTLRASMAVAFDLVQNVIGWRIQCAIVLQANAWLSDI